MKTISEKEFHLLLANGAITSIRIVRKLINDKPEYVVEALLQSEERCSIRTTRGGERTWANLDRLVRALESNCNSFGAHMPKLSLVLGDRPEPSSKVLDADNAR